MTLPGGSVALPAGYVAVEAGGLWGFAREGDAAWVARTLSDGSSLAAWAAGRPRAETRTGRGAVHVVDAPAGANGDRYAVRHYRRGGLMAPLLGDRYLAVGTPRPLVELMAATAARGRGVATPAVVAGTVRPAGLFYRADLVTEYVPGYDLARVLWEDAAPWTAAEALEAAGRFVARVEHAGLRHPDLNARNLLLDPVPGATVHVLDLDGARMVAAGGADDRMRRRLRRSLHKLERAYGRPLSGEAWAALHRGLRGGEA